MNNIKKIVQFSIVAFIIGFVLPEITQAKDKFIGNWLLFMAANGTEVQKGEATISLSITKSEGFYNVTMILPPMPNQTSNTNNNGNFDWNNFLQQTQQSTVNFNLAMIQSQYTGKYLLGEDNKTLKNLPGTNSLEYRSEGKMLCGNIGCFKKGNISAESAPRKSEKTLPGEVAVIINVPGLNSLKMNLGILDFIYTGQITSWNDDWIAKLNPGVAIPNLGIMVFHISDSSATKTFTKYLCSNKEWAKNIGYGSNVKWPVGNGCNGNAGMESMIRQYQGAIGYVDMAYAKEDNLFIVDMVNRIH